MVVTGDHAQLSRTIRIERPHLVLPGADGIALMGSVPELADLPVVFISGYGRERDDLRGPEGGRRRLPGQALLADRADRPRRGGASPRLPARAVRPRRAGHPLRGAPGDGGRAGGRADRDRVRAAARPLAQRRPGRRLRCPVRQVWSGRKKGAVNFVRNFAKKLRAKLGDDAQSPAWIFSVRGVGYRMPNPGDA